MRAPIVIALFASFTPAAVAAAEPSSCEGCHAETLKRPAHQRLVGQHPGEGCTSCHGGDGAAKEATAAHTPTGARGMLPAAHTAASCARCHLPGSVPGTEALVSGARTYQDLGCPFCHQIAGYGAFEAWALPLDAVGHRGATYLSQMLNTPYEVFPGTRMPSFTVKWKDAPARESNLVSYLLTLRGEPRPKGRVPVHQACASCHASKSTDKSQISGHRCVELADPKKELSCQRCHPGGVPESERECLYVTQRRFDCGVCHVGERDEKRSP